MKRRHLRKICSRLRRKDPSYPVCVNYNISNLECILFARACATTTILVELRLCNSAMGCGAALILTTILHDNTTLHTLDLSNNAIPGSNIIGIVAALSVPLSVRRLYIAGDKQALTATEAISVFEMLNENSAVFDFSVSVNETEEDDGLFGSTSESLYDTLMDNTTFLHLNITGQTNHDNGIYIMHTWRTYQHRKRQQWAAKQHAQFPAEHHTAIYTMLLSAARFCPRLPPEIWSASIFPYFAFTDFIGLDDLYFKLAALFKPTERMRIRIS